jgi:hypothetical protein
VGKDLEDQEGRQPVKEEGFRRKERIMEEERKASQGSSRYKE